MLKITYWRVLLLTLLPFLLVPESVQASGPANSAMASWREQNLTVDEIAWLEQHPQLKMGVSSAFAPYEWVDSDGRYIGVAADYFHLLEQRLGIKFIPVTDKLQWNEVLKAARKGEYDLISCLVKTDERANYLDFSEPYLFSSAAIVSEQGGYVGTLEQLRGKTVAIHKGHFTDELLRRDYPEITIVNTDTIEAALKMVSEGSVNAFVGDGMAASYAMKKEALLNLTFSGNTDYRSGYRIGVSHGHPILLGIIQKALQSVTDSERNHILGYWADLKFTQGIPLERIIKIGVFIWFIFLFFIYWNLRLRRSEAAYRLSEKRFKALVDTSDGMVWEAGCDSDKATYMSENAVRILGYSIDSWLQPRFWFEHIHPDDRDQIINLSRQEVAALRDHMLEYRFLIASGETVWIRDMVRVVLKKGQPCCLRGLMLDITEQKKAAMLMHQSELRFRDLIQSLPAIAVQGYDEERRVIYWNKASELLYGYTRDEVQGQRLEDLIIPENMREIVVKSHQAWLEEGQSIPAAELDLRHKDGTLVPVFSSHVMLKGDDQRRHMYCIDVNLVEQKRARAELTYMAHFDSLTHLPNRRTFTDRLLQMMKISKREGTQVAVMMIDLDRFKEVNDTLGHDYGDFLLKQAAKRLSDCVRETDTVARLGGDEFLVMLGDIKDAVAVERVARKLLLQLSEPFELNENRAFVSGSIGITFYPSDATSLDVLMKNADQAMYTAKAEGRNRFHYFTPEMEAAARRRSLMLTELREAVSLQQLEVYYQPIIDLNSGKIVKAEALLRWNHPKGQIPPLEFIPLAEETGLIVGIGNWVFTEVVRQVSLWKTHFNTDLQVGINTSAVQYLDENCCKPEWFGSILDNELANALSPTNLCVEITESLLMEAGSTITDKLLQFRDHGIEVALDDFGTGYSSLAYLKQFHIDYLKIDKSFVSNLSPDSQDLVLCEAIIVMAHTLGIRVIAEGVETELQRQLLAGIECDFCQGYLFGHPLPAQAFSDQWLAVSSDSNDHN